MPFAAVASSNTTADTSSGSVTVAMPSGIVAGDLLMVFWAQDAAGTVSQSGGSDWSNLGSYANGTNCSGGCFAKIAAGGDSLTLASTNSQDFSCVAVRITGHGVSNVATDITNGTAATGADASPNPPDCNPGTAKDYLWVEHFAADDDDDTATYWSTNYTGVAQIQSANSASSCLCAVASRQLNASAENPGAMALAATEEWCAQTFAIPPGPVTGTAAGAIGSPTGSASGEAEHHGAVAGAVSSPTGSASGVVNTTHTGTVAGAVAAPTGDASGLAAHAGTVAGAIASPTGDASGIAKHEGTVAGAVASPTGDASGLAAHVGAVGGAIPSPTGDAAGEVTTEAGETGTVDGAIAAPTGSASGLVSHTGTVAGAIASPTGDAAGLVAHHGTVGGVVPSPTGDASGLASHVGTVAGLVPSVQGAASGSSTHQGSVAGAIPSPTGSAVGMSITELTGEIAGLIGAVRGTAQGFVGDPPETVAGIAAIVEAVRMSIETIIALLKPAGHIPDLIRSNVDIAATGQVLAAADAAKPIVLIGGSITAAADTTVEIREDDAAGVVLATQFLAAGIPFPLALLAIDVAIGVGLWLEPTGAVAVTGRAVSLAL
jgi:hypothetical protein